MLQITISEQDSCVSSEELCASSDIDLHLLYELVEHNIANPMQQGPEPSQWQFSVASVLTVKKAARIKRDLALDWEGIALILDLLDDRESLEHEVITLKQQLNRFKHAS
ncbi:MAG: chaperone modulator CbpM [Paraglaciecola sp.]|uniref:chaperone modulator CbpM n=1 Tax=Pseudomonadati TaxID=3379134 RepID=UPI00273FEE2A|nr:chaperone modulator CbpM [Paraglaciecola sp.]MDP5029477.1 chaperone modulator CbpM [Paraglaciecola sp.]MDP5129310.1 chaperone modulator CbpM [Paraglaciecola sp.]